VVCVCDFSGDSAALKLTRDNLKTKTTAVNALKPKLLKTLHEKSTA